MFEEVQYYTKSDVGLCRYGNEDHSIVVDPSRVQEHLKPLGIAFVIADGIGGHAAGEIASRTACEAVAAAYYGEDPLFRDHAHLPDWHVRRLEMAIRSAHDRLVTLATANVQWRGMGTTLSALVLTEGKAIIGHVGDSRIYRRRNGTSERMTVDHTKSQALIDMGAMRPEERSNGCYGHILTHALGGYDDLTTVFTRIEAVLSGDLFLLCTDGLHGLVTDAEIAEILRNACPPQTTCDELVQAALQKGGDDNVTVIVVQV
jgi:protein phosphatase